DITFTFPDPTAAQLQFTFRIFNSTGDQVWQSDTDTGSEAVETPATLERHSRWKRLVSVPLVIEGKPLDPGVYTLESSVDADKQLESTVLFEVVAAPKPPGTGEDTGIKG